MIGDKMTPFDAIQEFYRLKNEYESSYYKKYLKPILKSNASKREKRLSFSKLPKNTCIHCQRNVGTLFSIVVNKKETVKQYLIKCGDIAEPCSLDIEIQYSIRDPMDMTIQKGMENINRLKMGIICEKNNAIFFGRDVTASFEAISDELKAESETTGFILETNLLRNDNPEKRDRIKRLSQEFGRVCLVPFKAHVQHFIETNDTAILKHAIQLYQQEMLPQLKTIRELKYHVNMVEYDADKNVFQVRQFPHSLEDNEFYFSKDDKIIKVQKGQPMQTQTNKKTKTTTKTKTVRAKPLKKNITLRLVGEDEGEGEEANISE